MKTKKYSLKEQKKVWNAIAPEWNEYKEKSSDISKEFLSNQKGNILDLGSGSGRHLTQIKKGKMTLVDFSEDMISLARKKAEKDKKIDAEFIVANIAELPFENNSFDGAISISSLHCLPKMHHKKAITELYRVLKPKAQALIGVWNIKSKRFKRAKTNEKYIGWTNKGNRYYYLFDEDEIHNLFKEAGFKILSTHNSEMMINFIAEK